MWSFKPQSALSLIFAAVLLAACGFQPLYQGDKGRDTALALAGVKIAPISDRTGQLLRNELTSLINPRGEPRTPNYDLTVTYTDQVSRLAVQVNAFSTRANFRLTTTFHLTASDGENLLSSQVVSVSSYDIFDNEYATLVAEKDARLRAAKDAARAISTQLAAHFRSAGATAGH